MAISTHEVTIEGDRVRKRFVGWNDGEPDREWNCLVLLAEYAPGLAPVPLERSTDRGSPVIIMERLPGTPMGSGPLTDEQNAALATALNQLFDVPLAAIAASGLEERRLGPNALIPFLRATVGEPHDLTECREPELVHDVLLRADEFLQSTTDRRRSALPAMGIADLNPDNVLWDGGCCRLVDFEDGGRTLPAFDLADHVEHIGSRLRGVYDADRLIREVGAVGTDLVGIKTYRVLWAIFWLLMLLPGRSAYRRNPRGTTESQARHVIELLETV